ncbi:MAG: UDP-N-acetylmuramoyl-tripeptide--D-alanyl-D-alanine ligase [Chloroflexi bacterium]|jgi:UDP-N-acetylmuramoyl-tripeptide--D-alanyl-D-alanine ligase|nr:UDP-N-acetylmuramoyl-tripeptide--D-alanyl-D-alanine ligase [Chloroflexota bacterium]
MKALTIGHFLQALSDYQATGDEPALSTVVVDSRDTISGSLFVALAGERTNGHEFVFDAFDQGAIAALVERELVPGTATINLRDKGSEGIAQWDGSLPVCILVDDSVFSLQEAARSWRDQFDVKIIGITGSVGKSSTKELTYTVLSQRYQTFKSPGNRNSVLGLPPAIFDLGPEHERAVLEMGMYSTGEIKRLCEITRPKIGVVTMIGPVHLERAGTIETIVAAKRELVELLPSDGVAILNRDDQRVMEMASHTRAQVFTYGLDSRADLWADQIHSMGLSGIRFTLHHRRETLALSVPMLGRHSVHTALRATAVGLIEDLSWEEIAAGLSETRLAEFRLVAVAGPRQSIIIDDTYNSSPDSALAALNLLSELEGRHIAVLGDMLELGWAEEESHRLVGRRAADVAQILIAIGNRSHTIADEAIKVGMSGSNVYWLEDPQAAIPLLGELIHENDVILVKGSYGMRLDQIVSAIGRNN